MKKNLLTALSFALFNIIYAQDSPIEFQVKDLAPYQYRIFAFDNEPVIALYQNGINEENWEFEYTLKKLDANYKDTLKRVFTVPDKQDLIAAHSDESSVYVFFAKNILKNMAVRGIPSGTIMFREYTLVKIDKVTLNTSIHKESSKKHLVFKYIETTKGQVHLGFKIVPFLIKYSKKCLVVHSFEFNGKSLTKKEHLVGGNTSNSDIDYIDLTKNDSLARIDLMYKINIKGIENVCIREINSNELGKENIFNVPEEIDILGGKVFSISINKKIIVGNYLLNKNKAGRKLNKEDENAIGGIFISEIENDKQTYIKLLPYSKFKNFTMSLPTENNSRNKSQGFEILNDEKLRKVLGFAFHDIIVSEDEITLFLEPYFPLYASESRTETVNGQYNHKVVRVFKGYRTFGACVLSFDQKGNLNWENGFKLEEGPLTFWVHKQLVFNETDNNGFDVIYPEREKSFSRLVYQDKVDMKTELSTERQTIIIDK